MDHSLTVTDLTFARREFQLGPVAFAVGHGKSLAIVGPSGSGKTTLLRCLAGLERPTAGAIRIGETQVFGGGIDVRPDRRGLGLVFQDGALWPHMTALQHLQFAAPGRDRTELLALLQRAGLAHLERRRPAAMSGGEAQRLGLLRALAGGPGVLLLDEPLRSVDVHQRDGLVLLLRTLADERQVTTVLVTHDRDEALALATDLVVLHRGRVVEAGAAGDLLQRPQTAFAAAFLAGAACLPATPRGDGAFDTPFGALPGERGGPERALVLLPGDVVAHAAAAGAPHGSAHGRVLSSVPRPHGADVGVALGEHLVHAHADAALPVGSVCALTLRGTPRLLPWDRNGATP